MTVIAQFKNFKICQKRQACWDGPTEIITIPSDVLLPGYSQVNIISFEELKQKYIKADLPVSEDLIQLEEQGKAFELDELKPSELKPKMTLLQVLLTVVQYFALAFILYMFMYWTANVPGAKMAMEILQ